MSPTTDKLLTHVEALVADVSGAMLDGDGLALEQASAQLRSAAADVAQCLAQLPAGQRRDARLLARVKRIQAQLGDQRGGVARYAARAEHALHAILPASRTNTYGNAKSPYGTGLTQTGAFKVLAA